MPSHHTYAELLPIMTFMQNTKRLLLALFLLALPPHASAELDAVLTDAGWDEIDFDDKPTNAFFATSSDVAGLSLRVVSESSVSVAFKPYAEGDVDLKVTPKLTWSWLSRSPDPDTDTSQKGGDDRTLAIYVAFPYQPDEVSFGEKVERKLIEALRGKDTPGRVLTYVWGGGAPVGQGFENPYTGKYGHMIIVEAPGAALNTWHDRIVDVRADFISAFGYEPASPLYIGIGSDSDDTATEITAEVRGLRFVTD